jgi:hypothetical protein
MKKVFISFFIFININVLGQSNDTIPYPIVKDTILVIKKIDNKINSYTKIINGLEKIEEGLARVKYVYEDDYNKVLLELNQNKKILSSYKKRKEDLIK